MISSIRIGLRAPTPTAWSHLRSINRIPINPIKLSINQPSFRSIRFQSTNSSTSSTTNKPIIQQDAKLSPHDSKASGFSDIKRLFQLAKPETKPMIGALSLLLISSAISMSVPLIIGKFLDSGNVADPNQETLIYGLSMNQFFMAIGGVFIIGAIANSGRVIILKTIGEKLVARLRTKTLKSSLEQDSKFLDNNRVGDLISRLSSDATIVSKSVTQNISDGIRAIISGGVGLTMMSLVSWKLTSIMGLLAPPLGVMAFFYGRKIRNLSRDLQKSIGDLTKVAEEQLNSTKTIQAYGNERIEVSKYSQNVREVFNIGYKEAKLSGIFFGTTGFIANIGLITLLGIGSNMIKNGTLTVGELSSFMMYAVYTGSSMFGLSNFYSEIMKGAGAAARIFELNDRKPEISLTKGFIPTPQDLKSTIEFRNVDFNYPTRPNIQIFKNLSLKISPGEHVCIVGPSGSGKSTITQLLLRFYDINKGEILINNTNIKNFNLRQFRKKIGVVQQEPALFSGTILDNITYGVKNYNQEDLNKVLIQANVLNFINEFPDKLNTIVGPRGTQLSGGQRQRIALARALLLDPSLLILDESTSALDTKSEKIISETLHNRSLLGKTTISIAHRVSTIKNSSRIIVIGKEGKVVETGSFNELIELKNSFLNQLLSKNGEQENDEFQQQQVEINEEIIEEINDQVDEQVEKDLSLNK
ncbi:ATP-dependent permease MDL1, mitochondrial [Wickerhamomyces ciferrii]|uniref:ATP-dependent permease MDL1, mitochondrial n=1 Tax=Wickerhamomyces ciferrii (strain ATCC 14091 / BCRC 22168 / CBS 111 / JCM 3599 / NBRC 0793 / NRRL Y-1031 F-60-10) TaxID=1206466 RepID=K0KWF0_WICCF|nr:ATP-dependent permease MDL1, mitochondrial [Wickerhamomyces ciferrii]CCH45819.1 ATP-dependent permease MDL1, mitochondrial [Wickerhamomyces ciferrii]